MIGVASVLQGPYTFRMELVHYKDQMACVYMQKYQMGMWKLFSLSLLEQLQSDYNLKNHQENNNVSDQLTLQAFDQYKLATLFEL